MNNTWWQEFIRFFLQGITLNRLIYMLIILIILIIITPAQIKEWINFYNPEIIPNYWMYYILLFCVSYVIASILGATYNFIKPFYYSLLNWIYKRKAEKYIDQLTDDEKDFICLFLDLKYPVNKFNRNNPLIETLVQKGVLIDLGTLPYEQDKNQYKINEYYSSLIIIKLSSRLS